MEQHRFSFGTGSARNPGVRPAAKPAACRRPLAGITLIELLVTLAIVAVAITVVGPSVGSAVDRVRLRSFANDVMAEARYAGTLAETSGRTVWMTFSEDAVRLRAEGGEERLVDIPSGVSVRASTPVAIFLPSGQAIGPPDIVFEDTAGHLEVLGLDPASGRLRRRDDPGEDAR